MTATLVTTQSASAVSWDDTTRSGVVTVSSNNLTLGQFNASVFNVSFTLTGALSSTVDNHIKFDIYGVDPSSAMQTTYCNNTVNCSYLSLSATNNSSSVDVSHSSFSTVAFDGQAAVTINLNDDIPAGTVLTLSFPIGTFKPVYCSPYILTMLFDRAFDSTMQVAKETWAMTYVSTIHKTVTFDANDGSGTTVTQCGVSPTALNHPWFEDPTYRLGYTLTGWSDGSGNTFTPGGTYNFNADVTLLAQWQANANTVTFDANGGSGSLNNQSSGSAADLSANAFIRSGFYFDGWNDQANGLGTDYADEENYSFASDITLYAQWRAIPVAPSATVIIQVPVGQPIANAPVALEADGLKVNTGYTVTVHSTPQIIDQGTIWSGRLSTTVRIPSNLESGWHRLVIEGTAADGTPWVEETFFKVSASGTLLATADTRPAELAMTGMNPSLITSSSLIGGALLILGAGFMTLNVGLGRRAKRQKAN